MLSKKPQTHEIKQEDQRVLKKGRSETDTYLPQLPLNLKDLSIVKLPNEDEISFEEIKSLNDDCITKFTELINSDSDIFYLDSSFPLLFNQVINETIDKKS
jgi:hypothetical protein